MISDYFRDVEKMISETGIVADKLIDFNEFNPVEGMLRGRLVFVNGSVLEFMEYLRGDALLKYRYHFMDRCGSLIFRYDDAPHHEVSSFPHHKHTAFGVVATLPVNIYLVIEEITGLVLAGSNQENERR